MGGIFISRNFLLKYSHLSTDEKKLYVEKMLMEGAAEIDDEIAPVLKKCISEQFEKTSVEWLKFDFKTAISERLMEKRFISELIYAITHKITVKIGVMSTKSFKTILPLCFMQQKNKWFLLYRNEKTGIKSNILLDDIMPRIKLQKPSENIFHERFSLYPLDATM